MNPGRFTPLLGSIAFAAIPALADDAQRVAATFFEKEVRPVLVTRCFECHSDTKQKGGLRVDHIGYLKEGGDTGPALVAGKPEESALVEAVHYANEDFQMPPKKKLPDAEIAILEKWIRMGAPWPEEAATKIVVTEGGFTEEQRNYWFFQPVANVSPPQAGGEWVRNDIDRFIAEKRAALKLNAAPEADRQELVRRVYFDLHGLPPTKNQRDAFVNDPDSRAYEKLIDELLASPRYGERWAQHWLDLVRYAESDGYNQDAYRSFVWPYRDYVIKSFNDDKPYDQFVREQLAGDEIAPENPEALIATAFLRHPVYEYNLRDVRGQWDLILTDLTDTAGELFLGLSMGCARCHNHKFDPILQKDYYRLRSFFTPVLWRDDLKLVSPAEKNVFEEQEAKWEAATATIRAKMDALTKQDIDSRVKVWRASFTEDLQAMTFKPAGERDSLEKQLGGLCDRQLEYARAEFNPVKNLKSDAAKAEYQSLQEELSKFQHLKPKPLPEAFVATDAGQEAPPNLLKTRKGDLEIEPGFLSIVDPNPPRITPMKNSTGRRKALADWITRPDNQLSTRVIVNRVWQYHFGRGIVPSTSEFGTLGEKPSHPELLDFLAVKFMEDGWSVKRLIKEIVLSRAYRQSSARTHDADPDNVWITRMTPRLLEAEALRDAVLAVSAQLDTYPPQKPFLNRYHPQKDAELHTFKPFLTSADLLDNHRSVYLPVVRGTLPEIFTLFNFAPPERPVAQREESTLPAQALHLMNNPWIIEQAGHLARRVTTSGTDVPLRLTRLYELAFARKPSEIEINRVSAFLGPNASEERWTSLCQTVLTSAEFRVLR